MKKRKNPFNSELTPHTFEEKDSQLLDRAADQTQTPNEGEFLYKHCVTSYMWVDYFIHCVVMTNLVLCFELSGLFDGQIMKAM